MLRRSKSPHSTSQPALPASTQPQRSHGQTWRPDQVRVEQVQEFEPTPTLLAALAELDGAGAVEFGEQAHAPGMDAVVADPAASTMCGDTVVLPGLEDLGLVRAATSPEALGDALGRVLPFEKYRIEVRGDRYTIEGKINPWVLIVDGVVEEVGDQHDDRTGWRFVDHEPLIGDVWGVKEKEESEDGEEGDSIDEDGGGREWWSSQEADDSDSGSQPMVLEHEEPHHTLRFYPIGPPGGDKRETVEACLETPTVVLCPSLKKRYRYHPNDGDPYVTGPLKAGKPGNKTEARKRMKKIFPMERRKKGERRPLYVAAEKLLLEAADGVDAATRLEDFFEIMDPETEGFSFAKKWLGDYGRVRDRPKGRSLSKRNTGNDETMQTALFTMMMYRQSGQAEGVDTPDGELTWLAAHEHARQSTAHIPLARDSQSNHPGTSSRTAGKNDHFNAGNADLDEERARRIMASSSPLNALARAAHTLAKKMAKGPEILSGRSGFNDRGQSLMTDLSALQDMVEKANGIRKGNRALARAAKWFRGESLREGAPSTSSHGKKRKQASPLNSEISSSEEDLDLEVFLLALDEAKQLSHLWANAANRDPKPMPKRRKNDNDNDNNNNNNNDENVG